MANDKKANNKKRKKAEKGNYNSPFAVNFREITGYDEKKGKTKISQSEISADIGVSRQTVSEYLLGNTQPNAETIIKIAKKFEVSSDYLLGLSNAPTNDKDLQFICDYTGLSIDTVKYISEKNTSYNFKSFIEFIVAYAKENYMFINSLNLVKSSAKTYQAQILTEKALMRVYEANGEISDDIKSALYDVYKNDSIKLNDKEKMKIFAFLKNNYIADKYELSEIIKNILNEYSVSGLYTDNYDEYTFQDLKNDEKELGNSNYFYNMAKSLKEGETNEEKES